MKRIGYLITPDKITEEFCRRIIIKAAKGKTKRRAVVRILSNIKQYACELRELILQEKYIPSPYTKCVVTDHPSGKKRLLHKPRFFPDQCVHHVLVALVEENLLKRFDNYAIASLPKKGIHFGYKAIKRWLRDKKGTKYCLKCDIKKCYQSIKPKYVVDSFRRFIKDKKYLALLEKVAYSHESLPLGNYTSAWFENLLLLDMDTIIRQQKGVNYYLRYVDDFIVLSGNKRKLRRVFSVIQEQLARLELRLKENWQLFKTKSRGIDMLGYRFFYGYILLRKRSLIGLFRTFKKYIEKPCKYWAVRFSCRIGGLKWFNSWNLRIQILDKVNLIKLRALCNGKIQFAKCA